MSGDPSLPAAEYREVQDGRLTDNRAAYPLSAYFEGAALERYQYLSHVYDSSHHPDLPATFEQTDLCERMLMKHAGEAAARAVREGNVSLLSYLTGLTHREVDLSEARTLMKIVDEMRRPGWMPVFVGHTDGGKTNTALWLAFLALLDDPDMVLATNVTTLEFHDDALDERVHYVESKSELRDLCDEYDDIFAVLDEFSTEANAQTSNYDVNEHFYELVTFKSKLGLRMIVIGHREDGYDIAPALREHSTYFVKQVREEHDLEADEYHAEFYDAIDDGNFVGEQFTIDPVPSIESDADYDPDETATFEITD
ncbi:hypothetical protein [Natranaeroarchaeum aerophilus]|uniref:Uncharacterized protein n=1 Tax=Natranaeroarchaeum aerophilus TaxID=2917711 RepID=A0AAE3FPI7_9EURY|nr:hypothetical protein [Natranaeroarchaeum aerophilus]MCL9812508.1 hypothetical protein [Natranaeroarchaeum aerophilus]